MRAAFLLLASAFLFAAGPARAAEEILEKAFKAYGDPDAISKAKTLSWLGVLKAYGGGGVSKLEYRVQVRFPSDLRTDLAGIEGTFWKEGTLVLGKDGWKFQREACRRMAPDEVDEIALELRDLDWLGRIKRGEQRTEPLGDQKFDDVECAGVKCLGDPKREVKLWFDKSTGLLYRRDEAAKGREGGVGREYTIFEDYQEFGGIQVATTRTTYVNQRVPDTETEKFELAQKIVLDEFTLGPEIPGDAFQPPADPFAVAGLSGDAAKKKGEELLAYFKGRRDPDLASWAATALARMKAVAEIQSLLDTAGELKYFGCAAKVRLGGGKEIPEDFRASVWRKKVAASQGYAEGPAKVSVRFVGAAGVALQMGGASVFVDAFYQPGLFNTPCPAVDPASVAKADLLLFTHSARNHFDPWVAAEVLARTKAKAFGPPSVVAMLRERGVPDAQLVEVRPEADKPVSQTVGAVEVVAVAVGQAGEYTKEGKPEHVAWILKAGGAKVVHFGTAGEPKGMDEEAAKNADAVFMPHWM
ncbi:MAG: MBL fold metallo-hydrolase, partial [Planctomycetes bacterium]|nr:MBL fold metallo-hydrolase [Planctomycetota bacterium]